MHVTSAVPPFPMFALLIHHTQAGRCAHSLEQLCRWQLSPHVCIKHSSRADCNSTPTLRSPISAVEACLINDTQWLQRAAPLHQPHVVLGFSIGCPFLRSGPLATYLCGSCICPASVMPLSNQYVGGPPCQALDASHWTLCWSVASQQGLCGFDCNCCCCTPSSHVHSSRGPGAAAWPWLLALLQQPCRCLTHSLTHSGMRWVTLHQAAGQGTPPLGSAVQDGVPAAGSNM